jgi:hypothetical protein
MARFEHARASHRPSLVPCATCGARHPRGYHCTIVPLLEMSWDDDDNAAHELDIVRALLPIRRDQEQGDVTHPSRPRWSTITMSDLPLPPSSSPPFPRLSRRPTLKRKPIRTIPDLSYIVVKIKPHFNRAGHILVLYRHDREGNPYIYHVESFYGADGIVTRSTAMRRGRNIVTYKEQISLRSIDLSAGWKKAVKEKINARKCT